MNKLNPTTGLPEKKSIQDAINEKGFVMSEVGETSGGQFSVSDSIFEDIQDFSGLAGDYESQMERLAQDQTSLQQWQRGITKFAGKTLLNTAGGIAMLATLPNALLSGDFSKSYDNDFHNWMNALTESLDENVINYYTQAEKDANFWRSLGSANFWANDVLGGASFIAGAILTETLTAGLGSAALAPLGKSLVTMLGTKLDDASRVKDVLQKFQRSKFADISGKLAKGTRQTVTGAGYEAGVEANHAKHEIEDMLTQQFIQENGVEPNQEELAEIKSLANQTGNGVFALNLALISRMNVITLPKTFGKGTNKLISENAGGIRLVDDLTKTELKRVGETTGAFVSAAKASGPVQKFLSKAYKIAEKPVAEGFIEEGGQSLISEGGLSYAAGAYDPNTTMENMDFWESLGEQMSVIGGVAKAAKEAAPDKFEDKDFWKEVGIGAILGGFGAPNINYKKYKETGEVKDLWGGLQGGAIGELPIIGSSAKKRQAEIDAMVEELNSMDVGQNAANLLKAANRDKKITEEYDEAIAIGDVVTAKSKEFESLFNMTAAYIKAGRSSMLIDTIAKDIEEMSIEEFANEYGYKDMTDEAIAKRKNKVVTQFKKQVAQIVDSYEKANSYRLYNNDDLVESLAFEIASVRNLDERESQIVEELQKYDLLQKDRDGLTKAGQLQQLLDTVQGDLGTLRKTANRKRGQLRAAMKRLEKATQNYERLQKTQDRKEEEWKDAYENVKIAETAVSGFQKEIEELIKGVPYSFNYTFDNFDDLMKDMDTVDTVKEEDRETVFELIQDLAKLQQKRKNFIDLYNFKKTKQGQEAFIEANEDMKKRLIGQYNEGQELDKRKAVYASNPVTLEDFQDRLLANRELLESAKKKAAEVKYDDDVTSKLQKEWNTRIKSAGKNEKAQKLITEEILKRAKEKNADPAFIKNLEDVLESLKDDAKTKTAIKNAPTKIMNDYKDLTKVVFFTEAQKKFYANMDQTQLSNTLYIKAEPYDKAGELAVQNDFETSNKFRTRQGLRGREGYGLYVYVKNIDPKKPDILVGGFPDIQRFETEDGTPLTAEHVDVFLPASASAGKRKQFIEAYTALDNLLQPLRDGTKDEITNAEIDAAGITIDNAFTGRNVEDADFSVLGPDNFIKSLGGYVIIDNTGKNKRYYIYNGVDNPVEATEEQERIITNIKTRYSLKGKYGVIVKSGPQYALLKAKAAPVADPTVVNKYITESLDEMKAKLPELQQAYKDDPSIKLSDEVVLFGKSDRPFWIAGSNSIYNYDFRIRPTKGGEGMYIKFGAYDSSKNSKGAKSPASNMVFNVKEVEGKYMLQTGKDDTNLVELNAETLMNLANSRMNIYIEEEGDVIGKVEMLDYRPNSISVEEGLTGLALQHIPVVRLNLEPTVTKIPRNFVNKEQKGVKAKSMGKATGILARRKAAAEKKAEKEAKEGTPTPTTSTGGNALLRRKNALKNKNEKKEDPPFVEGDIHKELGIEEHQFGPLRKNNPNGENPKLTGVELKAALLKLEKIAATSKTFEEFNDRMIASNIVLRHNDRQFFNDYFKARLAGKTSMSVSEFLKKEEKAENEENSTASKAAEAQSKQDLLDQIDRLREEGRTTFGNNPAPSLATGREDFQPVDFEKVVQNLNKILPGLDIARLETLKLNIRTNKIVAGVFLDNVAYLATNAPVGTEYHEAFHYVYRSLMTEEEQIRFMAAAKRKYSKPTKEQLADLQDFIDANNISMTATELYYEEEMAEDFRKFMNRKNTTGSSSFLHRMFQIIKDFIKSMFKKQGELNTLFKTISNGGYANTTVKRSISDPVTLAIPGSYIEKDGKIEIASYLNRDEVSRIVDTMILQVLESNGKKSLEDVYEELRQRYDIKNFIDVVDFETAKYLQRFSIAFLADNLMGPEFGSIKARIIKEAQSKMNAFTIDPNEESETSESLIQADWSSVGGFDSLSDEMRMFISMIPTEDEIGGYNIASNGSKIYNGLALTLANTPRHMLYDKLVAYAETNPNAQRFVDALDKAIRDEGVEDMSQSNMYNKFLGAFDKLKVSSFDTRIEAALDKNGRGIGVSRMDNTNSQDAVGVQLDLWISRNRLLNAKTGNTGQRIDQARKFIQSTDADTLVKLNESSHYLRSLLRQAGFDISEGFARYMLLKQGEKFLPELIEAGVINENIEDILALYSVDLLTNEEWKNLADFEDANSRLAKLAAGNAVFDERVVSSMGRNLEGKPIYEILAPNYYLQELMAWQTRKVESAEELKKALQDSGYYYADWQIEHYWNSIKYNPLLNSEILEKAEIGLNGGVRQTQFASEDETSSAESLSGLRFGQGMTFKHLDSRAKAVQGMYQFVANTKPGEEPKNVYISTGIMEGKSTNVIVKVPKPTEDFYKGKVTDEAVEFFYQMWKQEDEKARTDKTEVLIEGYNAEYDPELGVLVPKDGRNKTRPNFDAWMNSNVKGEKAVKEEIRAGLEKQIEDYMKRLEELNVISDNSSVILPEYFVKDGKASKTAIANYFLIDYGYTFAINNLTDGDTSLQFKNPVDYVKRNSGKVAAGQSMGNGNSTIAIIKDVDTFNEISDSVRAQLLKGAKKGKTPEVNSTDAQSLSTVAWMRDVYNRSRGKATAEVNAILTKIERGIKTTLKEDKILEKSKADLRPRKLVQRDRYTYIKTSTVALTRELTSTTNKSNDEINAIYDEYGVGSPEAQAIWKPKPGMQYAHDMLDKMEREGIDIVAYESASKTAKIQVADADKMQKYEMPNLSIREQVNTDGNKMDGVDPTQTIGLIRSEQDGKTKVTFKGKERTIQELIEFADSLIDFRENKVLQIIRNTIFHLDNEKVVKQNYQELFKILDDKSNSDPWLNELFSLEGGQEKYSWNMPIIQRKFQEAFYAYMGKALNQHSGRKKYTLVSDQFYRKEDGKRLQFGKEKDGHYYAEVAISASVLRKMGWRGNQVVDIPASMANQFGVRIPTQDKHSMVTLKVVGVLPAYMGPAIMLPSEVIALSGADFDVDSLFARLKTHMKGTPEGESFEINRVKEEILSNIKVPSKNRKTLNELFEKRKELIAESKQIRKEFNQIKDLEVEEIYNLRDAIINKTIDDILDYQDFSKARLKLSLRDRERLDKLKQVNTLYYKLVDKVIADYQTKGIIPKDLKGRLKANQDALTTGKLSDYKPVTKEEADNILVDLFSALANNKGNKEIAETPATLTVMQDLADELAKYDKDVLTPYGTHSPLDKSILSSNIDIGAENIGPAALFNVVFQKLVKHKVQLPGPIFGQSEIASYKDSEGGRINDAISTIVSAMTDNAKEQLASKFNMTIDTLGPALLMLGTGLPFGQVLRIMKQPVMKDIAQALSMVRTNLSTQNEKTVFNRSKVDTGEAYTRIFMKYGGKEDIANLAKLDFSNVKFDNEALEGSLKNTDNDLQLYILSEFLVAKKRSDELRHFSTLNSLIKGVRPTVGTNEDFDKALEALKDVDYLQPPLKELKNRIKIYKQIQEDAKHYLLPKTEPFISMKESIANELKYFDSEALTDELVSFLSMKRFKHAKYNISNKGPVELLFSHELADRLDIARQTEELKDNLLLHTLFYDRTKVNKLDFTTVRVNSMVKYDPQFASELNGAFLQLYLNPETNQLARDLVDYILYKDGLLFKSGTYVRNISPVILQNAARATKDIMDSFSGDGNTNFVELFGEDFTTVKEEFKTLYMRNPSNRNQLHTYPIETNTEFQVQDEWLNGQRPKYIATRKGGLAMHVEGNTYTSTTKLGTYSFSYMGLGLDNALQLQADAGGAQTVFNPVKSKFSTLDKLERQEATRILKHLKNKFGIDYKFYKDINGSLGYYEESSKTVHINELKMRLDTPFHEFAHPFILAIQQKNPKLYAELAREAKKHSKYKEISSRYAKEFVSLPDPEAAALQETIVTLLGEYASQPDSLTEKQKNIVQRFLEWVASLFNGKLRVEDIPSMSIAELSYILRDPVKVDMTPTSKSLGFDSEFKAQMYARENFKNRMVAIEESMGQWRIKDLGVIQLNAENPLYKQCD